jgi:hypothetical protein
VTPAGAQSLLREHASHLLERKRRESQAWRDASFADVLELCDAVIASWEKAGFLSLLQADEVGAPFELLRIYLDLSSELICGVGKGSVFAKKIWEMEIIRRLQGLCSVPAPSLGAAVQGLHAYQVEVFNLIENLARSRREFPWLELFFDHSSGVFSGYITTTEAVAAIEQRLDDPGGLKALAQAGGALRWATVDLRTEIHSVPEVTGVEFPRLRLVAVHTLLHAAGETSPLPARHYIYLDQEPVLLGCIRTDTGVLKSKAAPAVDVAPFCPQLSGPHPVRWDENEWLSAQGRKLSSLLHLGWAPA